MPQARAIGHPDLETVVTPRWHDFRHEAISRCFDAGWTAEKVMDFSGHVDIKSLLRYRHPKIDDAVARLRRLAPATPPRLPSSSDLVGRVVAERVLIES